MGVSASGGLGLRVQWVPYGLPAAGALRACIASAKGDEALAPVSVVVPNNYVGVGTRRLLASGALGPVCGKGLGLIGVTFLTPYRLAELLGAAQLAASGRRPVSTPVIAAALRAALADEPGLFGPVAQHPATESALVDSYKELRDLSGHALDALCGAGTRAADVVRLHRNARDRLATSWYDEQDLIASAEAVLRAAKAGAVADRHVALPIELGSVIVYLPQRLSRCSGKLLWAVGAERGLTVVAGATGDPRADAEVVASVARIEEETMSSTQPNAVTPYLEDLVSAERTKIVMTSDADDEVRAAVRAVVGAVRDKTPLDRIAILHASPQPYARLIHEQLLAAGIKSNGASVMALSARVAGRTLLQLLALPEGGFRRADFFAWLAGAPVRYNGRPAPVTAWERLSREAAVVAGRDNWDHLLQKFAEGRDLAAAEADATLDTPAWKVHRYRAEAERARNLRSFALTLIDDLARASARPKGWGDHAAWARSALERILGGAQFRQNWPAAEIKAAEKVERALDRLAALDEVEGPVDLDVFNRTLELELDGDLGRIGRFGEGVLVGSIDMGPGLDLDLVIVLGLAEGTFPARITDDSLLPDAERAAAGGELPLRGQRTDRQHRELLACLAWARRQVLGVPLGDLRKSSDRTPSRWVLDVASALAGERWWSDDLKKADAAWIERVPSFSGGLRRLAFPATAQEHRLRSLLATGPARLDLGGAPDKILRAAATVTTSRRSARFTRFDGNLDGLSIPSPADTVTSATRLEKWAACPFGYLLETVLGAAQIKNPEDELTITAITKGSLVHDILEQFIKEMIERPEHAQQRPGWPWSPADRERLKAIAEYHFQKFESEGLTGRPIFWRRDRSIILREMEKVLDEDNAYRRAHGATPIAAELAFGFSGAGLAPVALPLPDGRSVRFRGMADRLDVADGGVLNIVDYKSGRTEKFKGLCEDNPDMAGTKLQLPVYAAAARMHQNAPQAEVQADYWFVSTNGKFQRIGYRVTPQIQQRVQVTLGAIVAGIEAGVFPNFSTATSTSFYVECDSCDPDNLGVAEIVRGWERKRNDPALKMFAGLADPSNTPAEEPDQVVADE